MRNGLISILSLFLIGCSQPETSAICQDRLEETYVYEDEAANEVMLITRRENQVAFQFGSSLEEIRESLVWRRLLEGDGYIWTVGVLIPTSFGPTDLRDGSVECEVRRSSTSAENELRIECKTTVDDAVDVVILDRDKGITSWQTFSVDGEIASDFVLVSEKGLFAQCAS